MKSNPLFSSDAFLLDYASSHSQIRTFFDIGAHEGGYSSSTVPDMEVHAFEPIPEIFSKLKERLKARPNTFVNNVALSDVEKTVNGVTVVNSWTIAKPDETQMERVPEFRDTVFDVKFITLDNYCRNNNASVGVIKLDADGYEPKILYGARTVLLRDRPWIYCELSYLPQKLGFSTTEFISFVISEIGYAFCACDGSFATSNATQIIDFLFPWNTSFDVMLVPVEFKLKLPQRQ